MTAGWLACEGDAKSKYMRAAKRKRDVRRRSWPEKYVLPMIKKRNTTPSLCQHRRTCMHASNTMRDEPLRARARGAGGREGSALYQGNSEKNMYGIMRMYKHTYIVQYHLYICVGKNAEPVLFAIAAQRSSSRVRPLCAGFNLNVNRSHANTMADMPSYLFLFIGLLIVAPLS